MTLKELLGDAFHDGMTAEEILFRNRRMLSRLLHPYRTLRRQKRG